MAPNKRELKSIQDIFEYNTDRNQLILKEYGRNVQNLIQYVSELQDRDMRNAAINTVVTLMKQLNPSLKEANENAHRVWDHLYVMADFDLDIDGPFPAPDKNLFTLKPLNVPYKSKAVKFRHYGRNVELLIEHAATITNEAEQLAALAYIGRLMKSFYSTWNKDSIDDAIIIDHIYQMSEGKIKLDAEVVKDLNLFDGAFMTEHTTQQSYQTPHHHHRHHQSQHQQHQKKQHPSSFQGSKKPHSQQQQHSGHHHSKPQHRNNPNQNKNK